MIVEFLSALLLTATSIPAPQDGHSADAPLPLVVAQMEQTQVAPPNDDPTTDEEEEDESAPTPPSTPVPNNTTAPVTKSPILDPNLPANPLTVGNYRRDYEGPLSDAELRYQSSINSGFISAKSKNTLEGSWELSISNDSAFVMFEFRQIDKVKSRIDGAWRGLGTQPLHYGFLSDVTRFGNEVEINFVRSSKSAPHIIYLSRYNDDLWRGIMLAPDGSKQDVVLKRQSKTP